MSLLHGGAAEGERVGVRGPVPLEVAVETEDGVTEEGTGAEAPPET